MNIAYSNMDTELYYIYGPVRRALLNKGLCAAAWRRLRKTTLKSWKLKRN